MIHPIVYDTFGAGYITGLLTGGLMVVGIYEMVRAWTAR